MKFQQEFKLIMRSSNILLICVGLLVTGILIYSAFLNMLKSKSEAYAEGHAMARTRMDIKNLTLRIQEYVLDTEVLPAPLRAGDGAGVNSKALYSVLFEQRSANYQMGQPTESWNKSKDLVDRWGKALNVLVSLDNGVGAYKIRIWSNGPNEINENGTGDDITGEIFRVETRNVNK
jgi:hypothetical protein